MTLIGVPAFTMIAIVWLGVQAEAQTPCPELVQIKAQPRLWGLFGIGSGPRRPCLQSRPVKTIRGLSSRSAARQSEQARGKFTFALFRILSRERLGTNSRLSA